MTGLFDILVQVAGLALLAILIVLIYRRKVHRYYPFFAAYVTYALALAFALLCVTANYKFYFWTYWVGECGSMLVTLLALHEVFRDVLYGFYRLWWFRLIFPGTVAVLSFFAIHRAMLAPAPYAPRVMYVIFAMDSAVSYMQAGVFLVFLALVLGLRARWRRFPYGIALGFAVASQGTLLSYTLFTEFGIRYVRMAKYASPIFFILGGLVWLWMLTGHAEPEPGAHWNQHDTPKQFLEQVKEQIAVMRGRQTPERERPAGSD